MTTLVALIAFLVIAGGFSKDEADCARGSRWYHAFPLLFGSVNGAVVGATVAVSIMMAQPLFSLLGMVTVLCMLYLSDIPPDDFGIFPEKIFELTDKAVLVAIPFFVVSGAIMTKGYREAVDLSCDCFDGLDPWWPRDCSHWWLCAFRGNQRFLTCNGYCDWRHDVPGVGEGWV